MPNRSRSRTPTETGNRWANTGNANWGNKTKSSNWGVSNSPKNSTGGGGWGAPDSPKKADNGWGAAPSSPKAPSGGGWGAPDSPKATGGNGGWGDPVDSPPKPTGNDGWGNVASPQNATSSGGGWGAAPNSPKASGGGWGDPSPEENKTDGWGSTDADVEASAWGNPPKPPELLYDGKKQNDDKSGGWGGPETEKETLLGKSILVVNKPPEEREVVERMDPRLTENKPKKRISLSDYKNRKPVEKAETSVEPVPESQDETPTVSHMPTIEIEVNIIYNNKSDRLL